MWHKLCSTPRCSVSMRLGASGSRWHAFQAASLNRSHPLAGGWEADLERLTLAPTPPAQSRSGTASSSGRQQEQRCPPPTGRKPDQQLFSAGQQNSSGRLGSPQSSPSRQCRSAQPSPSRQTNGHAAGRLESRSALRAPRVSHLTTALLTVRRNVSLEVLPKAASARSCPLEHSLVI